MFLRAALRLIARHGRVESLLAPQLHRTHTYVKVHRFEETIGGRSYQIEVTAVSDRWRAQLRRTAGMPTAMMPFYGPTPEAASSLLTQWLTLANQRRMAKATNGTSSATSTRTA